MPSSFQSRLLKDLLSQSQITMEKKLRTLRIDADSKDNYLYVIDSKVGDNILVNAS